jgi:hypothetical protein
MEIHSVILEVRWIDRYGEAFLQLFVVHIPNDVCTKSSNENVILAIVGFLWSLLHMKLKLNMTSVILFIVLNLHLISDHHTKMGFIYSPAAVGIAYSWLSIQVVREKPWITEKQIIHVLGVIRRPWWLLNIEIRKCMHSIWFVLLSQKP